MDDPPVPLNTRSGPIHSLPYTQECNDVAMMLIQHHKSSEYFDRAIDQFERNPAVGGTTEVDPLMRTSLLEPPSDILRL